MAQASTSTEPRVVLTARGLGKDFFGFTAVNNVNLDVHHARIHALIGPNGAGKTTVFNLLTKFLQPTRGQITLLGTDITGTRPDAVARTQPTDPSTAAPTRNPALTRATVPRRSQRPRVDTMPPG